MLITTIFLQGCASSQKKGDPYEGRMSDTSYSGQITPDKKVSRINAEGGKTSVADFKGKFIFANYAAPWCGVCVDQANAIKAIEKNFGDNIIFLTVITSASEKYEDIPNQNTAKQWANRFGLNKKQVVASKDHWSMTVPQNLLFSPDGQTLFIHQGLISQDQLKGKILLYMSDWNKWKKDGVKAKWMR